MFNFRLETRETIRSEPPPHGGAASRGWRARPGCDALRRQSGPVAWDQGAAVSAVSLSPSLPVCPNHRFGGGSASAALRSKPDVPLTP
jgi:hypothetical protein